MMAKIEHMVKVSVTEIEPIKRLLGLLHDHFEELPLGVRHVLLELVCDGKSVWDLDYFLKMGIAGPDIEVYLDGEKTRGVTAILPDTCEAVIWGKGVTKHKDIQVLNAKTGEPVCGVSND